MPILALLLANSLASREGKDAGASARDIIEVLTDSDAEGDLTSSNGESMQSKSDEEDASGQSDGEVKRTRRASPRAKRACQGEIFWEENAFSPKAFNFDSSGPGIEIHGSLAAVARAIDCVRLFFDCDMVDNIANETNEYARLLKNNPELRENSKMQKG